MLEDVRLREVWEWCGGNGCAAVKSWCIVENVGRILDVRTVGEDFLIVMLDGDVCMGMVFGVHVCLMSLRCCWKRYRGEVAGVRGGEAWSSRGDSGTSILVLTKLAMFQSSYQAQLKRKLHAPQSSNYV